MSLPLADTESAAFHELSSDVGDTGTAASHELPTTSGCQAAVSHPCRQSSARKANPHATAAGRSQFLYGGLVPPSEQLFRNNMEMLARPQLQAGCKVDVFLVLATTLSQSQQDSFEEQLRAIAADAGAALADTAHFEEDKLSSTVVHGVVHRI